MTIEPGPHVTRTENLVKFGHVVFETCERTNKRTNRHTYTHTSTLIAIFRVFIWGKVNELQNNTDERVETSKWWRFSRAQLSIERKLFRRNTNKYVVKDSKCFRKTEPSCVSLARVMNDNHRSA